MRMLVELIVCAILVSLACVVSAHSQPVFQVGVPFHPQSVNEMDTAIAQGLQCVRNFGEYTCQ